MLEWRGDWPGWAAADTLLLPVDPAAWSPPAMPIEHAGLAFAPKHELHVTVVGKALGARLRHAITTGHLDEADVRAAFETQPWRARRSGWRVHLRKPGEDGAAPKESIVELLAMPAMARFHSALARLLDQAAQVPPPHVTLYVRGDSEGIGVPDAETLARLRVGAPWRV
jgi:hypothetical protein